MTDSATDPNITVVSGGLGLSPAGTPGVNTRTAYIPATPDVTVTNSVIVAAVGSVTRTIILPASHTSPFWASGGQIRNAAGTVVGTCGVSEFIVGWAGKIFTRSTAKINGTPIPTGTSYGQTDLVSIFTDLCNSADPPIPYSFAPGFNETLIGYITNRADVTTDLSNLLSVFRKIVYQKRNSELVFAPYPTAAPTLTIPPSLHVSPPELTITAKDQVTDAINFSFRAVEAEFDSRSIRVGGDSDRVSDFTLEITATTKEAALYAQRLRNYQLSQTISGSLHLHPVANSIEGGDVFILGKLTEDGTDLPIVILRVETGADGTVKADFINWVPEIFLDPNLLSAGTSITTVISRDLKRDFVDTEPRSNRIGLTYYTEDNSNALLNGVSIPVSVGNLAGTVLEISLTSAKIIVVGQTPVVNTEYYIYDNVTGEGSWVKVSAVFLISEDIYILDFESGLYASNRFPSYPAAPNGLIILGLSEQNTGTDSYAINTFQQSGDIVSWPFNTKKRLREPYLASIEVSPGSIYFNRQAYNSIDDNDLGEIVTIPLVYFVVKNETTGISVYTSSSNATVTVSLATSSGDIITIKQTDAATVTLPYTAVNTYTVP
jgi:hypothetical protein